MNWYKEAKNNVDEKEFDKFVKDQIRQSPLLLKLMESYLIPQDDLDNHLSIRIKDLHGKFAEGNGSEITLDPKIVNENFVSENFHFIVHEFWHWVKRRSEELFYFNDDEEVQSFSLAAAWELMNNGRDEAIRKIYPIVKEHYENEEDAKQMFSKMFENAKRIVGE